jgi:hypothetical protein
LGTHKAQVRDVFFLFSLGFFLKGGSLCKLTHFFIHSI